MVKRHWVKALLAAVCGCVFCMVLGFAANGWMAKAENNGDANETNSYSLMFGTEASYLPTDSPAGWWSQSGGNNGHTVSGDIATIDFAAAGGTVYHQGVLKLTAGEKYILSIDYKLVSGGGYFHIYQTGDWKLVKDNIKAGDNWQTFDVEITATQANELIILQDPNKNSVIQFTNIKVYEFETRNVTSGATIGKLPEIPEKAGYAAYWAINGEKITEETVYNYSSDKVAKPTYKKLQAISFEGDPIELSSSLQGWKSESGGTTGQSIENGCFKVDFAAAGKVVYNNFLETTIGGTYRLSVSYKKISGTGKFHIWHGTWQLVKDWIAASDDWETCTATYQATSISEGITLQEPAGSEDSIMLFKVSITRIFGSNTVFEGAKIGELPEIPEKKGYTGYWKIGDTRITADTICCYTEDRVAKLVYDENPKFIIRFGDLEKQVTYKVEIGELPENTPAARRGYKNVWIIDGKEIDADTVYTYNENKTATEKEVVVVYTIEFKIFGVTVSSQTYTVETKEVEIPALLSKEGYTSSWEEYALDGGDKVVNAVYTKIQSDSDPSENHSGGESKNDTEEKNSSCAGKINGLAVVTAAFTAVILTVMLKKRKNVSK